MARSASRLSMPSQPPTMTRRLRGSVAVTSGENIDTAMVAPTVGVRFREAHDDVRSHGVAEHGEAAVAQRAGEGGDGSGFAEPRVRVAPSGLGDAAGQGGGVTAVAGEVEGHCDVAVAREGRRKGPHELLRAGEAVRDHDHRAGRAGRGAEDRGRGAVEGHGLDRQAGGGGPKRPGPCADREECYAEHGRVERPPAPLHRHGGVRPPPRRSGRGFGRGRS